MKRGFTMANKTYVVNDEKKIITIDFAKELTEAEDRHVRFLMSCGYSVKPKSQARAEKARERALKSGFGKKKETKKEENKK